MDVLIHNNEKELLQQFYPENIEYLLTIIISLKDYY
jgi:hypothetical protein